jgi:hypothetical protein
MTDIVPFERASSKQAAQCANAYVASFPNTPAHPAVLIEQITARLTGLPCPVLSGILNPQYGAVTRGDSPSLERLNKFIEEWLGRPSWRDQKDTQPEPPKDPLTGAERERVARVLENAKRALTASSERLKGRTVVGSRSVLSDEQNKAIEAYIRGE